MTWKCLPCSITELQLIGTLNGGQSFRWKHDPITDEWTGIFAETVWKLTQNKNGINYKVIGSLQSNSISPKISNAKVPKKKTKIKLDVVKTENVADDHFENILKSYFRLDVELSPLYEQWSKSDPIFEKAANQFYGLRILNQEPVENLFSFICSQNNHISRISSMVEKLCSHYGKEICREDDVTYYSFPRVADISNEKVENELRELGFGYRAKFIQKSASQILEWGDEKWFESLRKMPYSDAKTELVKLHGIGAKVADCICLMSLGHLEAVPVDTHVFQIASENYLPHLKGVKSVTEKVYNEIGDHFRNLYGPYAGWAHTVLFCADLKKFQQNGIKRMSNQKTSSKTIKKKNKCK